MTIPRVHLSPLHSSATAYILSPGGHSTPSAVAVPERTFGVPGPERLVKSVPGLRHSSGGDASIHRAVERPRPERRGTSRLPGMTDSRRLQSRPVQYGSQRSPDPFTKVLRVAPGGGCTPLRLRAYASSTRSSSGLGRDPSGGPVAGFHTRHEKCLTISRQSSQDEWGLDLRAGAHPASLNSSSCSVSTHRVRHSPKRTVAAATKSSRR